MEPLQILDKSLALFQVHYPEDKYFHEFVEYVKNYVKGEITVKQLTEIRNIFRSLTIDLFIDNVQCYNAACAAEYASYALIKKEHAKITDQDIEIALKYCNDFAVKAGII